MSKVLQNLRRAQERGELSREDAQDSAEFHEYLVNHHIDTHRVNEREARTAVAAWIRSDDFLRVGRREFVAWQQTKKARSKPNRDPVPESTRLLQAIVGAIVGGLAGVAVSAIIASLVHAFFAMGATRVRVPIKGVLVVLIAPIAGVVLGAWIGWRFDAREWKRV